MVARRMAVAGAFAFADARPQGMGLDLTDTTSNNPFGRTRNQLGFHRELGWFRSCLPRRLIQALGGGR